MKKRKYIPKRLNFLAVEIKDFYNKSTNKREMSYCYLEDKWRPTSDFDYFKVGKRKPIIHAVCKECVNHGVHFGNCFRKNGYFKKNIVEFRKGVLKMLI